MLRKAILIATVAVTCLVPFATGTTLNPGESATPDLLPGPVGTLLASITGTITTITFAANYSEWVYSDSQNVYCAGCLDFVYQVSNTGPGVVERLTSSAFGSFEVDAGYIPGSGIGPTNVSRSDEGNGIGDVVGFNFPGNGELRPGETSDMLVLETNAHVFIAGLVSIQDGSAGTGNGYAPAAVPEPVTLSLLGFGMAFLGFRRLKQPCTISATQTALRRGIARLR